MRTSSRALWLLFAVAWGTNHFVPMLIVYRARLHLTSIELAILFGVYALGLVPGLVLGGPLSDRVGRKSVMLPASIVALLGTGILSRGAEGFPLLLAGRFVIGLGAGATFSAGTAWVQDLAAGAPEGTGARRAAVALSSGFGGGPLVTSILAQWLPWPMQLPYFVHAAMLILPIVAVALVPPEPGAVRSTGTDGWVEEPPVVRRLPVGFWRVAAIAPWVFVFPSVSHAVLPALVRARVGAFAVVFAGVVTATTLLAGVLVQPVLRKWPLSRTSTFGLAAGALGLLCGAVATWAVWPAGVLVAAPLLGGGYGGCLIAGLRFIEMNTTPASRGGATGLYLSMTYVGFGAPLLLASMARSFGEVPSLVVAFAGASVTLLYSLRDRARSARQPAA